ncbi:MAG: vitamin B12-dependent ribonucleotide reductase [Candidatus Omnitrophica bacterium]|nr:vitamin B12-dependent ribonucleotide reductase [Candidatus Omnitrophota bacterium]
MKDANPVTLGLLSLGQEDSGRADSSTPHAGTKGLTIPRYFTAPGSDPFREVTWELRTASIANEQGETVFEQAQVEIPSFWSQTATNVVVSKYFRGPLGTPQRESSVKQLISRVVNTITDWGIKDRTFAGPEEAENFRAELTHLLLMQKASFNSPVWFNVGIEPKPQCSACQPHHALINTSHGLIPIGEIVEKNLIGLPVYDDQGLTQVVAVKSNGRKPVYRIRLNDGFTVEATGDHLVCAHPVRRTHRVEWHRVDQLEPGMLMRVYAHAAKTVTPPAQANAVSEAALAGWLQADGFVGQYKGGTNRSLTVEFITVDDEEFKWKKCPEIRFSTIASIEPMGEMEVYDIQTASGRYLTNSVLVHNCFILSVQDTMDSILDWYRVEGMIFKYGSGSGVNLSPIRSSKEHLAGGGTASGPVSFMRAADASAGVIKSGGKTRRAAKMVVLNADHPDVEKFIRCKWQEEKKAWTLVDAGYDSSIDGEAYSSVFFQNANNSVRATDEFMRAVVEDGPWELKSVVSGKPIQSNRARDMMRLIAEATWHCGDPGMQFDTTINRWHTCPHTGRINASNPCSEYMSLDDSSCNLASLNLMRFVDEEGRFRIADFRAAVRTTVIAMDILVDNASYPTSKIAENSKSYRQLGLGYANLGALLMSLGIPYDSDEGRAYAATVTALTCGEAYRTSAEVAGVKGPYAGFAKNREPQLGVIRMHRDALIRVDDRLVPEEMFAAAAHAWEEALRLGTVQGIRNSQVTVLAPTGTIGFMLDCDTTGVEPDIALIKYKKLVGGGLMKIVNGTVPGALKRLGCSQDQIKGICDYLNKEETIEGAPGLDPKHLPVFDCAFKPVKGSRSIHYMGHVRMMGAVQPFISGAISKTVNVPAEATIEEIMQTYIEAWKAGVKAIAIYRDGSKRVQPLSTGKKKEQGKEEAADEPEAEAAATGPAKHLPSPAVAPPGASAHRRYLPDERQAITHKFSIAGHDGYLTVGLYEDGKPGEIFIVMSKEGTVISGLLDAFATAISLALQYGVPLEALVKKFSHMRFEPAGITSNPQIRFAQSILDYLFRWMALKFLPADKQPQPSATVTDLAAKQADVTVPTPTAGTTSSMEPSRQAIQTQSFQGQVDAPPCPDCGAMMIRSGNCYKCFNCGATSGCS